MARCKDWGTQHDHTHGSTTGWLYHGCRCVECESAYRCHSRAYEAKRGSRANYARTRRAKNHRKAATGYVDFTHGRNGYQAYGCRCDVCKRAYSDYCTSEGVRDYHRAYVSKNRTAVNEQQRLAARSRRRKDPTYGSAAQARYRISNREVMRERSRDYYWQNREYELDRSRRKRQGLPRCPASNAGSLWTTADDAIATNPDMSLVEAAYVTGRSVQAVSRRRYVLSLRKEQAS